MSNKFPIGTTCQKKGRAKWRGTVCGHYRTEGNRLGVAIESYYEPGSVQIYPISALEDWFPKEDENCADDALKKLRAENARKDDLIERLKLEAQIHAQESRTQKSIVNECLQVASGGSKTKGNWNGSRPVKERIIVLEAENARLRAGMRSALSSVNALANHRFDMLSTNDVPVLNLHLNEARQALGADK